MSEVQLELMQQRNRLKEQCEAENKSMFTAVMQQLRRKRIAMDINIPVEQVVLKDHEDQKSKFDSSMPSSNPSIHLLQSKMKSSSAITQNVSTLSIQ
jgi:hypothetical protein